MIKINNITIDQKMFPDHSLFVKFDAYSEALPSFENPQIAIEWLYESDVELFTLICIKRHLEIHRPLAVFDLFMPYIPHARMDRAKNSEDVFTLKYFCEVINSLNFNSVHVRDAHSNVSLALLDRVYNDDVAYYINQATALSGANILFFPDEGAMKRYSANSDLPYAFGMKKREWETGKILGLDVINADIVKDKDILIVDDICSRGGTFYHSAKKLKELGAKSISLYVSHLEETVLSGDLAKEEGLIDHIYTTKSIFPDLRLYERYCDGFSWGDWITVID